MHEDLLILSAIIKGVDIMKIYSPPRVTAATKVFPVLGCTPGFAMDLTTKDENGVPRDFDIPEQRRRARERVE